MASWDKQHCNLNPEISFSGYLNATDIQPSLAKVLPLQTQKIFKKSFEVISEV